MKYIRTKDGRIGFVSSVREYNANKPVVFYAKVNGELYSNLELGDVQFADNVEELCDAIIILEDGKPHVHLPCNEHNIFTLKNVYYDNRFAIWTDKGLIYVAKMNEKGELELL